jgi:hypothetical protein
MSTNRKISNLPAVVGASILDADIIPLVASGVTSKTTIADLRVKLGFNVPAGGRTVTDPATYLANNAVFNVKDFGAFGDGSHDDYAAIQACINALPDSGGVVLLPTPSVSYYCSLALQLTKPTHFLGQAMWSGATVNPAGTLIEFAADQTGIYVDGKDTNKNSNQSPTRTTSAAKSIIENITLVSRGGTTGLLNGGTGVAADGIRVRTTQVQIRNTYIYTFHRNGVRIWATTGSGDVTIVGNANLWMAHNVVIGSCGEDGFSVSGTDVNVGLATEIDSSANTGRGFLDASFLGCTWIACHANGNGGRGFEHTNPNAHSVFFGCYQEIPGSEPLQSKFIAPAIVLGGILAVDANIAPSTTGLVVTSGRITKGLLQNVDSRTAVTITSALGGSAANQNVFNYGSSDTTIPGADVELVYDDTTGWYNWRDNGSNSRAFFSHPSRTQLATLRAYAPAFRNGLFFGVAGAASMVHHKVGSAPPGAGTWVKGDRVYNDYTVSGTGTGIEYWYCTVAGTPGTWVANRAMGTLTLGAAIATVVNDVRVTATSRIVITPTNASAGTLEAGANKVYVSAKTGATSFTLTTAAGGAAAGTETYDYVILN